MSRRGFYTSDSNALQFPRRSSRERQTIYVSLDENLLLGSSSRDSLIRSLVVRANKSRDEIDSSPYILPSSHLRGYSTRSKDRIFGSNFNGSVNVHSDEEDDLENRTVDNKLSSKESVSELQSFGREHRHLRSKSVEQSAVGKEEAVEPNMYESVKQRRQATRQAAVIARGAFRKCVGKETSPRSPLRRRSSKKECVEGIDEETHNGDAEEDDGVDSEENEPRHYMLRTHRNPVARFCIEQPTRSARTCVLRRDVSNEIRKLRPRRTSRSRSSTSDSETGVQQQRDTNGEVRYERRQLRRMNKARSHLLPINMADDYCSLTMDLREVLRRKTGIMSSDVDPMAIDKTVDFSKVGGLEQHIQSLKEVILFPLLYPEVFSQFNVCPPNGVLFYGPPGTGKTLVARALANVCSFGDKKVSFFMRKGADCLSKWVGESERQLRLLFEQAHSMRPSIIFFDEIDGLAPVRSSKQDQIHSSIVSTLLALMDGLNSRGEVVVIGATNRLDAIDPALRRPGRFDRELRFNLPDKKSRLEIMKIHTSSWNASCPSSEDFNWLAEHTSGYCGADLKSLCTEAVLVALRSRFPQIYAASQKLEIDPTAVVVTKKDFEIAMRRIVPAVRRDFSVPSRQLNRRLTILLGGVVKSLIEKYIPVGFLGFRCFEKDTTSEMEKIVNVFQPPPVVPSARLLLCGSSSEMGQTSYVLPAIVNQLDHLPVFSLSVANIFAHGTPEQSFSYIVQAAIRASSGGTPSILLIASIDKWFLSVPASVWNLLLTAVDSFTGFTSIILLASAECSYSELPMEILHIFHSSNAVEVGPPSEELLEAYFNHVIAEPSCLKPIIFNPCDYPELPNADIAQPSRRLSEEEIKELRKMYDQYRLELVLHYEETLARLSRDRRFVIFAQPVDAEEVPDYYTHIRNPMDLSTMFSKASEYTTPEAFLHDFGLIYSNAVEYNPLTDCEGRQIRIMAKLLMDLGQRAVFELDSKFLKRFEEVKALLVEAGVNVDAEKKILTETSQDIHKLCDATKNGNNLFNANLSNVAVKRKSPRDYRYGRKRRYYSNSIVKNGSQNDGENSKTSVDKVDDYLSVNVDEVSSSHKGNGDDVEQSIKPDPVLNIDCNKLHHVIHSAATKCVGWPITKLERFAAGISQKIDLYKDKWDRSELPEILIQFIEKFPVD